MNLLRIEHLTKRYAAHVALEDVSLSIPEGSIYGLLGPNGAGKSTLIRIINRIISADQGEVFFGHRKMTAEDIHRIGYLPEERGLYKSMKVGEQALFFAQLKGISRHDAIVRLKYWFEKFDISAWWNKKVDELSKGMAQKVQFIITVLHEPELLIFDEPFSGFDPINANLLKEEIIALQERGATVIFSTHNMSSVEELCDHITLINRSRNVLSGSVDEVRRSYGENIYKIEFSGPAQPLLGELSDRFGVKVNVQEGEPYAAAELQVTQRELIRAILGWMNERTEVHSFAEVIPGMNDIFIKTVSEGSPSDNRF